MTLPVHNLEGRKEFLFPEHSEAENLPSLNRITQALENIEDLLISILMKETK